MEFLPRFSLRTFNVPTVPLFRSFFHYVSSFNFHSIFFCLRNSPSMKFENIYETLVLFTLFIQKVIHNLPLNGFILFSTYKFRFHLLYRVLFTCVLIIVILYMNTLMTRVSIFYIFSTEISFYRDFPNLLFRMWSFFFYFLSCKVNIFK